MGDASPEDNEGESTWRLKRVERSNNAAYVTSLSFILYASTTDRPPYLEKKSNEYPNPAIV